MIRRPPRSTLSLHDALPIWFARVKAAWAGAAISSSAATAARTRRIRAPWLLQRDVAVLALRRSEEHTSELQSRQYLVCRLLLEKKKLSVICDFSLLNNPCSS